MPADLKIEGLGGKGYVLLLESIPCLRVSKEWGCQSGQFKVMSSTNNRELGREPRGSNENSSIG